MNKHLFFSFFLIVTSLGLKAQTQTVKPTKDFTQDDIKDKLVQLAYNNPSIKIRDYEKDKSVSELHKSGANWLNYLTASANFNEVTLKTYKTTGTTTDIRNQIYYPLWNVGLNIPLGSLVGKSSDVRIARKNVAIATAEQEVAKRQVKAMVLSKYHDYLMTKEMLTLQNELTEDDYAAFSQAETKLANGSISYEGYTNAAQRYNDDRNKKLSLERDLANVKLDIEEIIGVKLEEVIAQ
ncbi:Outer membrane efflux protein [Chitinophaga sp. CF118]|uniref:TolC family protein n=1 Tax=Chitinophaga sp. CF118 TaxID=1884367 RepID=UPI0008EB63CB|nr:TolC family protein [Chitinophaga sp. CF118]SFE92811.1 Outer membrane efflux protein [Chitinophaga sp. CF118]